MSGDLEQLEIEIPIIVGHELRVRTFPLIQFEAGSGCGNKFAV